MSNTKVRKARLRNNLLSILGEFKSALLLNIDNVGSNQMQQVRMALRGRAVLLMGKNTVIRKVMREHMETTGDDTLEVVLGAIKGNVGLAFTNEDLPQMRKEIEENQVPAQAKTGAFAPIDVMIPPGPTGLDPGQTQFFQALNIATKISRGSIEIINEVHIIKKSERVTSSAVALLGKLNIKPFFFGIKVTHVLDKDSFYSAAVLDMSDDDMAANFFQGVNHVAALSLALGYPTEASLPHSFAGAFKKLLAISFATDYDFPEAVEWAKGGGGGGDAPAAGGGDAPAADAKAAEAAAVEEEEEDEAPMADMFGGGDAEAAAY